jgi:hypothetical protein
VIKAGWSSRALFAQSLGLLRDHPVLALPVIFADILGLATRQDVVRAIRTPIFNWLFSLSQHSSVLSSSRSMFAMSPEHASTVASLIGATLQVSSQFVKIFLYSGALFVTSEWLLRIQAGEGRSLHDSRGQWRKLGRFSLVVLGGVVLTSVLVIGLLALWMSAPALGGRFGLGVLADYAILLELPLAYFIARPGLILVWRKKDLPGPSTVRLARLFAMGTIAAQFLIAVVIDRVVLRAVNQSFTLMKGGELLVRDAIISVAGAAPFIVSFIALSVLGSEDVESIEVQSPEAVAES